MYKKLMLLLFRIPWVKNRWAERFEAVDSESIPWTPLKKPLPECRIALVTTGGVHLKSDPPFDMEDKEGDPSYRRIPSDAAPEDLMITHDYYNHSDANKDINLVLPMGVLRNLQDEGVVGPSTESFFSFMGHIDGPHLKTLVEKTSKEVAARLKEEAADIALLVPA